MSKHTPGPLQKHGSHIYTADPERTLIAQVVGGDVVANLALFSAAPCLLEALEDAVRLLNQKELSGSDYEDMRRFERTIAKATKGDE